MWSWWKWLEGANEWNEFGSKREVKYTIVHYRYYYLLGTSIAKCYQFIFPFIFQPNIPSNIKKKHSAILSPKSYLQIPVLISYSSHCVHVSKMIIRFHIAIEINKIDRLAHIHKSFSFLSCGNRVFVFHARWKKCLSNRLYSSQLSKMWEISNVFAAQQY